MATVYSVEQINNFIKKLFASEPLLSKVKVRGEVSGYKPSSTGHVYFKLKDKSGVISVALFKSHRSGLKFDIKDGMQVVVSGRISVYEVSGVYQLYAEEIENDGIGELNEKFLKLKSELAEMGMFDQMYKKPIPKHVRKLGVVTSATGAVLQDIRNVALRRNPYLQIVLCPATVQGEGAAATIVNGIKILDEYGVDVIIVGRGGGSIEDLWAFNEEAVARAIFDCNTPIISAVGHETDFTIADFVADLRAPTPSAAAELAVFDISLYIRQTDAYAEDLDRRIKAILREKRTELNGFFSRLKLLSPQNKLNTQRQRLDEITDKLIQRMKFVLADKKHNVERLALALDGRSPLKRLEGGCAFLEKDGKKISKVEDVKPEDIIKVRMLDGEISAKVLDKKRIDYGN